MKRQFALIPAYKPNENLISFIQSLETRGLEVVVVNDGSGEDYLPLFRKIEKQSLAKVIHLEKNQGKGAALKAGLSYLNTINDDFQVITLDADGQHSLQDALFLLQKSLENEGSLLLGSRMQSKDSPLRSRIGNYITKKVFSLTTGVKVEDTQTGMRAFSKSRIFLRAALKCCRRGPRRERLPGKNHHRNSFIYLVLLRTKASHFF